MYANIYWAIWYNDDIYHVNFITFTYKFMTNDQTNFEFYFEIPEILWNRVEF